MADITVLTPSRNYAAYIEDAILSVQGQKGLSVQHVVQDGGSTDGTPAVLSRHTAYVEWVSEPDKGQSDALNNALAKASGPWVGWLNADEFYLPDALAKLVAVGERTGADVVYGDCVVVDEVGAVSRLLAHYPFSPVVLRNYGPCLSSCSAIFRRSALGKDPWDADIRRVMDWDLYLKLLAAGATFRHVAYPVGAFRIHANQVTAAPWQTWRDEDEVMAARHGRPISLEQRWKAYTRWRRLHQAHKLLSGAYGRERRARRFMGRDLRWFESGEAHANVVQFHERAYGRSGRRLRDAAKGVAALSDEASRSGQ
ncbi:MAG TPA: glycosyltransferase family 2 protein [Actinomycetota bacterium]|nr:glycosyltransferase family 2 protein [Actinomycetota bacterium]